MNRRFASTIGLCLVGLMLVFSAAAGAQATDQERVRVRTGFGAEYFDRQITWDAEAHSSDLKALLFTFSLEIEPIKNLSFSLIGGYSLTNFNGLVFRQMPFSVDLEPGNRGALLVGGGLKERFVLSGDFEIDLEGEFVTYLGSTQSWSITGLNQDGTLTGKGRWYRVQAGPVLWYTGFMYFSPYIRVSFDKLWGTFHVDETIGPLTGLEDKTIDGKTLFSVAIGTLYEPTKGIGIKGEAFAFPRSGGVDYGARGKVILSF